MRLPAETTSRGGSGPSLFGGGHEPPRRQDEADEDAARARHRHRADEVDGERREDPGVQHEAERERHAPPAPRRG